MALVGVRIIQSFHGLGQCKYLLFLYIENRLANSRFLRNSSLHHAYGLWTTSRISISVCIGTASFGYVDKERNVFLSSHIHGIQHSDFEQGRGTLHYAQHCVPFWNWTTVKETTLWADTGISQNSACNSPFFSVIRMFSRCHPAT